MTCSSLLSTWAPLAGLASALMVLGCSTTGAEDSPDGKDGGSPPDGAQDDPETPGSDQSPPPVPGDDPDPELLEGFDCGASTALWTLDPETGAFEELGWGVYDEESYWEMRIFLTETEVGVEATARPVGQNLLVLEEGRLVRPDDFDRSTLRPAREPADAADFDEDGLEDSFSVASGSNSLGIGSNTAVLRVEWGDGAAMTEVPLGNLRFNDTLAVDFDQDGALDVMYSTDEAVQLLPGNGDGTFQAVRQLTTHPGSAFRVLDRNDDGRNDLVYADLRTIRFLTSKDADAFEESESAAPNVGGIGDVGVVGADHPFGPALLFTTEVSLFQGTFDCSPECQNDGECSAFCVQGLCGECRFDSDCAGGRCSVTRCSDD